MRSCLYDGFLRNSQLDSLQRLENWVRDRLAYLDNKYCPQGIPQLVKSLEHSMPDEIERVSYYTLSGIPIAIPVGGGVYIKVVHYKNGQTQMSKIFIPSILLP